MNLSTICKSAAEFAQFSPNKSFFHLISRSLRAALNAFAGLMVWSIFVFSGQILAQPHTLLDPSFDGDGKAFTQFLPTNNKGNNAILQPDGKIIVVGSGSAGPTSPQTIQAAVVRYNPDGSPDTTFDGDGKVVISLSTGQTSEIKAAALQTDGKIVAVGTIGGTSGQTAFILRLNPDGSPDTTFDGDGIRTLSYASHNGISDVAIQPDGKIILAGRVTGTNISDFLVARLNPNGSYDTSFGTNNGYTRTALSTTAGIGFPKMALLADGKIVLTGQAQFFRLVRYTQNGLLDSTFGTNGIVFNRGGNGIVQQPDDGKLVVVNNTGLDVAVVWRFNYDGSDDATFGTGGSIALIWNGNNERLEFEPDYDVALDADGKILVGGSIRQWTSPDREFALARLNRDGSDDLYFGSRGRLFTNLSGIDSGTGLLVQPDGKIVLAGDSDGGITVARYIPGPSNNPCRPVADFDGDGKSDIAYADNTARWRYQLSGGGSGVSFTVGDATYSIVPGDYNGDCRTDFAAFKNGNWQIYNSVRPEVSSYQYQWGMAGDIPVPADYDGDDWADPAVYRNGTWLIHQTRGGDLTVPFGIAGDIPVPSDYDGDGLADAAVYRPSTGTWWLLQSTLGVGVVQFGLPDDKPVVGDYDGDGKSDIAVYRPSDGTWYLLQSTLGFGALRWGIAIDRPVPADYDGDGKTDIAVYRDGIWYILLLQSPSGYQIINFGSAADRPIQNAFIP